MYLLLPPGDNPIAVNRYIIYIIYLALEVMVRDLFVCIQIFRYTKDVSRDSSCVFRISSKGLVGLHDVFVQSKRLCIGMVQTLDWRGPTKTRQDFLPLTPFEVNELCDGCGNS